MATLNVNIVGKTTGADNSIDNVIQKVKNDLKSISDTPIRITVDAKGFEAVSKQATSLLKAQANLVKEENRLAVEREKTAQATEKRLAEEVKLSAKVKEVTEEQQKANAAAKEQAQQYQDATRAVKEYYAALRELQKTANDVQLGENGWFSPSGDWASLADNLNRVTTAFNSLTDAENVNKLSDEQQIKLKQTMAKEAENYALQIEKASNKEADAAAQAKNTAVALTDEEKAMKSAEVVSKSYADGLGDIIAHQEKMVDGNVVEAMTKYRDEAGNVTTVIAKLKDGQVQLSQTMNQASEATKKQADVAELASKKNSLLGDSLDRIIAKVSAWQVINWAISSLIGTFREAVSTMKEVDQELTNIQKVSNLTADEIQRIGDSAYDTASKYGVSAEEYLKAVYTFQKAGLGDSAEEMAELATKTMLVGDTTAEVATQFLISANAAWKYGGSIEALSKVVDEADKLNNNYAVSLQDIAEGLPIVGATAAQVGMTAEQTMAAISTIVASTGQSATKAATALRAIIMNLIGETGELDDGLVVTEETIASLNTVLNVYAKDALAAAEAEGKILDPMEAIAALAQAAEDGFLNQAQLFEVLSGLGGKLRTTQLTALVRNMEMYNSMLKDTADAAGTADKEIAIMLDSWNSKTQILKNTWTQFLVNFLDSKTFKDVIDILTSLVKILDVIAPLLSTLVGPLKTTVDFLAQFIERIREIGGFKEFDDAIEKLRELSGAEKDVSDSTKEMSTTINGIIDSLILIYDVLNPAGFHDLPKAWNRLKETLSGNAEATEEAADAATDAKDAFDDLFPVIQETTESTEEETSALEKLRTALDDTADSLSVVKTAFKDFNDDGELSYSTISSIIDKFSDLNDDSLSGYISRLTDANLTSDELNQIMGEMTLELVSQRIETENLTQKDQALIEMMLEEAGVANAAEVAASLLADKTDDLAESTNDATEEINTFNNTPVDTTAKQNAVSGLSGKFDELAGSIFNARDQLAAFKIESGDESPWQIDKKGALNNYNKKKEKQEDKWTWYKPTTSSGSSYVAPVYSFDFGGDGKGGDGSTKTTTKAEDDPEVVAIKAQIQAHKDKIALLKSELSLLEAQGASNDELVAKMREIQSAEHEYADDLRASENHWEELKIDQSDVNALSLDWWKIQNDINDLLEETVDLREDELDAIQSSIALEKQNLDFLEESGKSVEEQVAQIKKIQGQLHEEAEVRRANLETLKASGASAAELADAEAEIVKLSTEWWEYQNKIDKLYEDQAKAKEKEQEAAEKQRKELIKQAKEEALALLNAEEAAAKGPLQEELELLQAQDDALKDEREEAEKLLAVEKAREALLNAQNERNIRQYNASTGQWEWVANASTVAKAQEDLEKAEKSLSEYYAKREIEALKERINAVGETYDTLRDAVNDFAEAVENGTASWDDAQNFLLSAIANFGEAVNTSAIAAASAFTSIVGGVTGATSTKNSTGGGSGSSKSWMDNLPQEQREFYLRLKGGNLESLNDFIMINGDTVQDWANVAKGGGNAVEAWRDENGVGEYFRWHAAHEGSGQDVVTWLASGLAAGELTEAQVEEVLTQKIAEGVGSKTDQQALKLGLELLQNGQYYTYYDGGGILRGIGGIKATKQDEMVLPPSATKAMLDAEQNGSFNALLRHLGIITATAESYAGFGGSTTTRIGTQNNGDTYQFGNITLSEAQAKSMYVYDLACMAGELSLHNAM